MASSLNTRRLPGSGRCSSPSAGWKAVLCVAITVDLVAGLVGLVVLIVRSVRRRREEMAGIAARADDQNEALLRGDDQWGVFGQKPSPPGEKSDVPIMDPPSTPRKPGQKWVIAGCAIAAGVVLFAALITVTARSADRSSGPMPAPKTIYARPPMDPSHRSMPAPAPFTPKQLVPSLPFPGILSPSTALVPGPPTGVPAKIGQPATDRQLVFVVNSFDRSKGAGSPVFPYVQATATGTFVNAHVTITNTGTQPVVFFAADQQFRVNSVVFPVDAAAALWTLTTAIGVNPGASVPVTLSFDVPTDTPPGGTLELHESSTSRGVDVALLPPN